MGKQIKVGNSQGLSLSDWHQRYSEQAQWTKDIRSHLLKRLKSQSGDPILEVGSGTGALLEQIADEGKTNLIGIDIDRPSLAFSKDLERQFKLVQSDGQYLPFANNVFTITICHYLLLWVEGPARILAEMCRVTRPGGCVIALAEPDHLGRIDYPPPLNRLGEHQTQALSNQGADIQIGRRIRQLFIETDLQKIETGILGAQWTQDNLQLADRTEWMMIAADLQDQLTEDELLQYYRADRQARDDRSRVLFIPTFFACGFVP